MPNFRIFLGRRPFLWVVGLAFGMILITWSMPGHAAASEESISRPSTAQLEEQVLQIIRTHPEVILESVEAYKQQQLKQQQQAKQAFLGEMKANPRSVIGKSPAMGAAEPKVVLLEFADFQCPYCAQVQDTLKQFMTSHQNEVTLVYKHLPLTPIHPEARSAAKAAWAAGQQGKFWQYHDALFAQSDRLGEKLYLSIAQSLSLDLERFNFDRRGNASDKAIQQDIEMANTLRVAGTPFFVMNGEIFRGAVELSEMENVLAVSAQDFGVDHY